MFSKARIISLMVLALSLFVVSSNVAQRIYKMYIILIFVITVSDFVWDK